LLLGVASRTRYSSLGNLPTGSNACPIRSEEPRRDPVESGRDSSEAPFHDRKLQSGEYRLMPGKVNRKTQAPQSRQFKSRAAPRKRERDVQYFHAALTRSERTRLGRVATRSCRTDRVATAHARASRWLAGSAGARDSRDISRFASDHARTRAAGVAAIAIRRALGWRNGR